MLISKGDKNLVIPKEPMTYGSLNYEKYME